MKTIDLFAGIGGIALGFQQAGFDCVYANDQDEKCQLTYQANFKHDFSLKNIARPTDDYYLSVNDELQAYQFDLVMAGFPCQSFSKAGKKQGLYDDKGTGELFFYLLDILANYHPAIIFFENVANLQKHNHGQTFGFMLEKLSHSGYYVDFNILNTRLISDLPQNRERLYLVGFLNSKHHQAFHWPESSPNNSKISDLLEQEVADAYYIQGTSLWPKINHYQFQTHEVYLWRRNHLRVYKNQAFPTLLASMGTGGHNVPMIKDKKGLRKLTPRECARIQGFSDDYILPYSLAHKHLYRQIGNSVSVPVIKKIAFAIKNVL